MSQRPLTPERVAAIRSGILAGQTYKNIIAGTGCGSYAIQSIRIKMMAEGLIPTPAVMPSRAPNVRPRRTAAPFLSPLPQIVAQPVSTPNCRYAASLMQRGIPEAEARRQAKTYRARRNFHGSEIGA